MSDEFDELELDLSQLPMPAVSESLDARVAESLQSIRVQSLTAIPARSPRSSSWRWVSLQAVAAVLLCALSYTAGRYSSPSDNSQSNQPHPQLDSQYVAVVQSSIEPAAQGSFERLIGKDSASETIWGPANGLSVDNPAKEEL